MRGDASRNTPLAPSTEKAYHQKCVELKRRLREIEEANDAQRLRKRRIDRSILKMRLERAFLLERLSKSQNQPPATDGEGALSDKSTTPPQTPQERAPRVRRQYQKGGASGGSPGPDNAPAPSSPPSGITHSQHASAYPPQPAPLPRPGYPAPSSSASGRQSVPVPGAGSPAGRARAGQTPYDGPPIDRRAPSDVPRTEQLPLIHSLPNGTNVVIIDAQPKQPPWTIRDVEPRHHLRADFERMAPEKQMEEVTVHGYTPYDNHGNPVVLHQYENGEMRHVFRDDPEWVDPVTDNVRMDDPFRQKR